MKKIIILFIYALLLIGCKSTEKTYDIKIIVPNGITLIAIGGLMNQDNILIEDVYGPDLLMSSMTSNSHDIVIAPINIGAKLYNSQGTNYKLAAILTFSNNFIVSRKDEKLDSIFDINNQDILAYGENSIPDFILKSVLKYYNINSNINYQASADQVLLNYISDSTKSIKYILSTEPMISKIELSYKIEINTLSLQEVIDNKIKDYPQAAIFINPNSDQTEIENALALIKDNVDYLNLHPVVYASKIIKYHSYFENLKKDVISRSIPRSSIRYVEINQAYDLISNYFIELNQFNPNLIGGSIPDGEFYYKP